MNIAKHINKNKIGGLILIIVIIIAFGFGGFGGGFMSNNQKNIAKINKTNVTTQNFIDYVNRSGISQSSIKENLDNNIIEELLSGLISSTLLDLEIKDFNLTVSEKSLLKKIKENKNFLDENKVFQRIKYEKFLLQNNTTAPIFEQRLKERELQKKLFDFVGAGTVSPKFLITKLFENENKKLELDFINLQNFYKKENEFTNQDLSKFIEENNEQLKVEYIDFKYALINPKNLIGVDEFNQTFFDKIDEIENKIINGISFDTIISEYKLNTKSKINYKYSENSNQIEKKVFELKNNKYDIFEDKDNYVIFKIQNFQEKSPDISDKQTRNEILKLITQKSNFDYNKDLLKKISEKKFNNNDFLDLGENKIETILINSVKDNKKFHINSVQMLYTMPINTFTLIHDENNNIFLAKIKNYKDKNLQNDSDELKQYADKEKSNIRNGILASYDFYLNKKYKVNINQKAINNVKNLFQ